MPYGVQSEFGEQSELISPRLCRGIRKGGQAAEKHTVAEVLED